jgi:hypothetical protein
MSQVPPDGQTLSPSMSSYDGWQSAANTQVEAIGPQKSAWEATLARLEPEFTFNELAGDTRDLFDQFIQ